MLATGRKFYNVEPDKIQKPEKISQMIKMLIISE